MKNIFFLLSFLLVFAQATPAFGLDGHPKIMSYHELQEKQKNLQTTYTLAHKGSFLALDRNDDQVSLTYILNGSLPSDLSFREKVLFSYEKNYYTLKHGDIKKTEKSRDNKNWKSYLFAQNTRSVTTVQTPKTISQKQLMTYLANHSIMIYTGQEILPSTQSNPDPSIKGILGLSNDTFKEDADKFAAHIVKTRQDICQNFLTLCKQVRFMQPTSAHYAIAALAKAKKAPLVTVCIDLLHEQTGIETTRLSNIKKTKKAFPQSVLRQIDAVVCIGLPKDDKAFLTYYRELHPKGKVIAINSVQPDYLKQDDYFVQGDFKNVVKKIKKVITKKSILKKIAKKTASSFKVFGRMIEGLFLTKDNFHVVDNTAMAYRSRQLSPHALENYINLHNIKTVVNLRGQAFDSRWWEDERKVVERLNVSWVNIAMKPNGYPSIENFQKLVTVFKSGPFPILLHCFAGSERTGEAAGLWLLCQSNGLHQSARALSSDGQTETNFQEPEETRKEKVSRALKQLSMKYRHSKIFFPRKNIFVKKFGTCYLWLQAILKIFDKKVSELTEKQITLLKDIAPKPLFFDHVLKALSIMDA